MKVELATFTREHIYVLSCSTDEYIIAEFHGASAAADLQRWLMTHGAEVVHEVVL